MSTVATILSDQTHTVWTLQTANPWSKFLEIVRPAGNPGEPAYLAAARAGDENALTQFYTEFKEPVWRLCRRLLRREADAEDVLQTTFIKAFGALPRFRGESSLKTWLFRIAVNEATSVLRRRDSDHISADEEIYSDLPSTETMSDADRVAVRAVLADLKEEFRTIIVLRYWEELSYEEIGTVLSLPLPSVKMRLHRAKDAFRCLYTGEGKVK